MIDIHSCSYYCDRPECIKAQRDELRDRLGSMTDRELMQQAVDALKLIDEAMPFPVAKLTIKNLRDRLAQPEQEPGTLRIDRLNQWLDASLKNRKPAREQPAQRKPLPPKSPCEMTQAEGKMFKLGWLECEAAHGIKEKNT